MDLAAYGNRRIPWRNKRSFGQEVQRVFALIRTDVPMQVMRQSFHDASEISRSIHRYQKSLTDDLFM